MFHDANTLDSARMVNDRFPDGRHGFQVVSTTKLGKIPGSSMKNLRQNRIESGIPQIASNLMQPTHLPFIDRC
jgi:hypothetical protein